MTIVSSGQTLIIPSGTVSGIIVLHGGSAIARTGGDTSGAVLSGGYEIVSKGSEAIATKVQSGGSLVISSGGTASGAKVQFSGTETISGGTDFKTLISGRGAVQYVDAGRTSGTRIEHSGTQIVSSGGVGVSSFIFSRGNQDLLGGESKYAQIKEAYQTVSSGGLALSATLLGGASQIVLNGGRAEGTFVEQGTVQVLSGGSSVDTLLSGSGPPYGEAYETVYQGARAIETRILYAGVQEVERGGQAIDTQVSSGGLNWVSSGGVDLSATISNDGFEQVFKGGYAVDTTILAGGKQDVYTGGVASNLSIEGGFLGVDNSGTAVDPVLTGPAGGTLSLESNLAKVSGSITFAAGGDILQIGGYVMPTTVISGFAPTDAIELLSVKYSPTDTVSVIGNEVTIQAPSGSFVLDIVGAANDKFEVLSGAASTILETVATLARQPLIPTSVAAGFNWQAMTSPQDRADAIPTIFLNSAHNGGNTAPMLTSEGAASIPVFNGDRG